MEYYIPTLKKYLDLKDQLNEIVDNHVESHLDPVWICVKASGIDWRKAKSLGMKKDYSHGWVFYTTSTNSNGYELFEKIQNVCKDFSLRVTLRSL